MLVNDQELDVDSVGGIPVEELQDLADVLVSCTYGILYHGLGLTSSAGKHHNIDAGINLVRFEPEDKILRDAHERSL